MAPAPHIFHHPPLHTSPPFRPLPTAHPSTARLLASTNPLDQTMAAAFGAETATGVAEGDWKGWGKEMAGGTLSSGGREWNGVGSGVCGVQEKVGNEVS